MAVLKCMHAYNVDVAYYTDVQTVNVMQRWTVEPDERADPWLALKDRALSKDEEARARYSVPNVVHVHSMEACHPNHADDATLYALLVICERADGAPFGVVCEQSSTYLMGDDGGTIDRL